METAHDLKIHLDEIYNEINRLQEIHKKQFSVYIEKLNKEAEHRMNKRCKLFWKGKEIGDGIFLGFAKHYSEAIPMVAEVKKDGTASKREWYYRQFDDMKFY